MDVVVDVASWSAFGLICLILLAGAVLARLRRKAHPTVAWLAGLGLLCVLADQLLGVGIGLFYPRLPPGQGSADYWAAQQLGLQSLHHAANLVGAVGWALVIAAVFAEARPPRPAGRTTTEGLR